MTALSRVRAGIAAVGVFALVACGGQPAAPAVDAAFQARASAVCADILEAKQAWASFPAGSFDPTAPDVAKLPTVAAWLKSEVAPVFDSWASELTALGAPATGQAGWDTFLALVAAHPGLVEAQVAAGEASDAASFAAATRSLQANHRELIPAAKAAGVESCSKLVS